MDSETNQNSRQALYKLRDSLQRAYDEIPVFKPVTDILPILDSAVDGAANGGGEGLWLQNEDIAGLGKLRESVKTELDALTKFLDDAAQPININAPYLLAVWNEVLHSTPPIEALFKSMPLKHQKRGGQRQPAVMVDVVADGGKRWIRVNTVKNSRLLAEFREIDSYLTDSDDSSYETSPSARPSLTQTEFDNSVLRMARSLLDAAKANPVEGTGQIPQVTLRMTRLDPSSDEDSRIRKTVRLLKDLGVTVGLGERPEFQLPSPSPAPFTTLEPTVNINLDLSAVVALTSDEEAYGPGYAQILLHGVGGGLLQEMHDRISAISSSQATVKFWTTPEARERCLRIIGKIGTPSEKRRAHALFFSVSAISTEVLTEKEAEELYWKETRYPPSFLSLFPIRLFPALSIPNVASLGPDVQANLPLSRFCRILAKTCRDMLEQENKKGNTRLARHTLKAFTWGAELGWTTLTANRNSVKAILREIKNARLVGRFDEILGDPNVPERDDCFARIWVVDVKEEPKSLLPP